MSRGELVHEKVSMSLRAPRVAVTFRVTDNWRDVVRHVLCGITPLWGAEQVVLIPHDEKGQIRPEIWQLLQDFDPDHVLAPQYLYSHFLAFFPTAMDMVDGDTQEPLAGEKLESLVRDLDSRGETTTDPLSVHVAEGLRERLPIFRTYVTEEAPRGQSSKFLMELSSAQSEWAQALYSSEKRVLVSQSHWTSDWALTLGALHGMVDAVAAAAMAKEEPGRRELLETITGTPARAAFLLSESSGPLASGWNGQSPALTRLQRGYSRFQGPIVVGDSAADFCLFVLCARVFGYSLWMTPKSLAELADDPTDNYVMWRHLGARGRSGNEITCVSTSLIGKDLEEIADAVQRHPFGQVQVEIDGKRRPMRADFKISVGALPNSAVTTDLYLEQCVDVQQVVPTRLTRSGQIVAEHALVPPLPPDVLALGSFEWIVDVELDKPIPPGTGTSPALFTAAEGDGLQDVPRRSRAGLSWQAHTMRFVLSGTLPQDRIVKPVIRIPSLLEWAENRLAEAGIRLQYSAAGKTANLVAARAGGRTALRELAVGPARRLLEAFRSVERNTKSIAHFPDGDGVVLIDEPFLRWGAMSKLLSDESELAVLVDELANSGLMRRGFVLNCQDCPHVSFVPVTEIGTTYRCPRCGSNNSFESARWRGALDGPPWFYDLHASMRNLWSQNGDLCLRTASRLSAGARSYLDISEFELLPEGKNRPEVEVDLLAIVDGQVVVVEAKTNAKFESGSSNRRQTAKKKLLAAKRFGADKLVLATSLSEWNAEDLNVLYAMRDEDKALKDLKIEVLANV